ncbi:GIY-YIG nuclease family protein [Hyalangium versicolor]|uniref:GIY-YIG nuclease family protein n=1 Tax=Hyalangium versicolor TaxID=2861190 RepID=UPI001CCA466E|nr:GIY-YIG nuclease family protein [Hyalangium versicolor]
MGLGRSIRIYLDGGEVTGIRHAEVVNWTGQAVLCPRPRINELIRWERETRRPGIYILIGAEQLTSREVYIGESESVLDRLDEHLDREFWQEVILFTSKDENLTKAHVRYLEGRLIEQANLAKRYKVTNKNPSPRTGLPRADTDAMEEFFGHVRLLMGALGHRFLEPLTATNSTEKPSEQLLEFSYNFKKAAARGTVTDEGFVVFKGSTAMAQSNSSMMNGHFLLRNELVETGKLKSQGEVFLFKEDVLFTSPTAAAAVICGNSVNGRVSWKLNDGRTLKEFEEANAKQPE